MVWNSGAITLREAKDICRDRFPCCETCPVWWCGLTLSSIGYDDMAAIEIDSTQYLQ